jgi:phage baseplate assembly protein W
MAYGFSPKLPLTVDQIDGPYKLLKTVKAVGAQNLKMLVLTNPGERIMNPDFGVGINKYLFEQEADFASGAVKERIYNQTSKYLPYINLTNVDIFPRQDLSNAWGVRITYFIPGFTTTEELFLDLFSDGSEGI